MIDTARICPYIGDVTLKQYDRNGMGQCLTMGFVDKKHGRDNSLVVLVLISLMVHQVRSLRGPQLCI